MSEIDRDENISLHVEGHVLIKSYGDDGDEVVHLNKRNAIHKENMSIAVARALSGNQSGRIYTLHFGTGGATVDALKNIVYSDPNVEGSADLNTPVYQEVVDQNRGAPTGNKITIRHIAGTLFTDVELRCVLDKTEPNGQALFDNVSNSLDGQFTFSEMGIKTDDDLLLTHITFNPIEKTANRLMEVIYTLRVRLD